MSDNSAAWTGAVSPAVPGRTDNDSETLGYWGGYLVQVVRTAFDERLVLSPDEVRRGYDLAWCYPPGGARAAAMTWDPGTDAEPAGFVRRAHLGAGRLPGSTYHHLGT